MALHRRRRIRTVCRALVPKGSIAALAIGLSFGLAACGGSDSGDSSVGLNQAPAATGSTDGGTAGIGANPAVDPSQLVSPVSQAPVGQQTVRPTETPPGQDRNPPRH
ncbi:hypothetical protein [Cupriavidus cauae]|uniref:Lipoprotein n=1 Tax=Cupriavidus cauae TaxID=2608999 RepID=A0A5M8ACH0_9BURK|nr:hypothetical protein [Cupriavidus cauae]KAA0182598.1 hypothetical protein FX016_00115 [Cupriavidus gilardii]KAA6120983.1 hypothetical protein F1599_17705 [Cupriavidus cauae]